eukprot:10647135-Karenia_brevis.AAC.1
MGNLAPEHPKNVLEASIDRIRAAIKRVVTMFLRNGPEWFHGHLRYGVPLVLARYVYRSLVIAK